MVSRETDLAAPLSADLLPDGIRSRFIDGINGLRMHFLEAGYESAARPCVLLLHGFPELAYSWRRVMPRLAAAGYHVVAPDQRGYGRTSGWDGDYDGDLASYRFLNLIRDALGLVWALGHRSVASVVGHDFGSPVAAWCALVRPDVFESVALMSAPFAGTPVLASGALAAASEGPTNGGQRTPLHEALAGLDPPRKLYQWYYSTREANEDMWHCPQGVHDFLRAYFHHKSADWKQNTPFPLASMSAQELAKLPTYYVMELDKGMAATVAEEMPSTEEIAACAWLPERDLAVYSAEYSRTGFQGGLQWYRCRTTRIDLTELQLFSGRTIDIPSVFIAGRRDWGIYQSRGAVETMQQSACTKMMNCHLVDGAGHWVQQEQPDEVSRLLIEFLEARNSGHG